jgi:hypothetical protein
MHGGFSILEVAMEAPCFNNNQRTWQKRLIRRQIGAGDCNWLHIVSASSSALKA